MINRLIRRSSSAFQRADGYQLARLDRGAAVSQLSRSAGDLYERLATRGEAPVAGLAGRGTETKELPETADADLALQAVVAPGLPSR